MSQESYKFNMSLRENVVFTESTKKDKEITELFECLAAPTIEYSSKGLDTNIGVSFYKDGIDLSGGETQKMAAVRAMMSKSDVLVFDEPVAALDPSSEQAFFDSILSSAYNSKTMIFVSHRLNVANKMDRIIYMQNGRILSSGSHRQLMETCERYRQYYTAWLMME